MKVSVAMITFNHEPYLAQAIESVLAQDLGQEFELVVGEDCSSDRTREIAEDSAERHPGRIRLLPSERHLGAMPNWLRTLRACRGEYIALLDGDDCWTSPAKLRRQIVLLDGAAELQLSLHVCREVYEDGLRAPHEWPARPNRSRFDLSDLVWGPIANSSALVCRRRVIDELPAWFVDAPVGDWALQLLSAVHGDIGFIDEVMSEHRNHGNGVFAGRDRAHQLRMVIETRRLVIPALPQRLASRVREAEFRDMLHLGRAHERRAEYRSAVGCYAYCRANLDHAGQTSRWLVYRRMLRARSRAIFAGPAAAGDSLGQELSVGDSTRSLRLGG